MSSCSVEMTRSFAALWISVMIVPDLAGRLDDRLGELADLDGDDREALAGLAGARGLDGGVEREDLGLVGDAS